MSFRNPILAIGFFLATFDVNFAQENSFTASNLPTVAESSKFTATSTGTEVETYLQIVAAKWKRATLKPIGQTIENRPLWALIVEPTEKLTSKPLTVLLLGGIHSGECDGKEALLALARDMSAGQTPRAWGNLRFIFVPNFNADANERRGKLHRAEQNGPEIVGIRENAQTLDLNRDFIKLETPEVRSLVRALGQYEVDVLIDTHTTNGSLHRYDLTYDIPHNPAAPDAIDQWLRGKLLPLTTERMQQAGFATYYYGNFDPDYRKWETYGHESRYSTEYMGVRGRIGILVESYSYASYQRRVEATYAFVRELLNGISEQSEDIRRMLAQSTAGPSVGQQIPLGGKLAQTNDATTIRGYQTADEKAPKGPYNASSANNLKEKDYQVQLWNRVEPTQFVNLPAAYAIDPQNAWAVGRLHMHGIQIKRLTGDTKLDVEQYKIENADRRSPFQGHSIVTLKVAKEAASVELKSGTYIVETSQPLGILVAHLLEPESDDGLAAWNFLDPDLVPNSIFPVKRLPKVVASSSLVEVESVPRGEKITLEHLVTPGKTIEYGGGMARPVSWLKDRSEYVIRREDGTFAVDAATGAMQPIEEVRTLASKLAELPGFGQEQSRMAATASAFTSDWKFALVNQRRDLYYFDATQSVAKQLTNTREEEEEHPELSPDGKNVAFIKENNLWTVSTETLKTQQLTVDGSGELLNGVLDWVYQEELYGRGNFKAFWWSPDSKFIAFLQLDQTPVLHYQVSDSTSVRQKLEDTRYPKAGDPIPAARMWVANVETGELKPMDLSAYPESDRLIARVTWGPDNATWLQVFNRVQNKQSLVRVDPKTGQSKTIMSESSPGWIEVLGTPEFLPNGDFLWLSDLPDGRRHLHRVSANTGQTTALTSGSWDIDSLVSVSSDKKTAFVLGNITHPTELHLIAVDVENVGTKQITTTAGTHRCKTDASGKFYIDSFSSFSSPPRTSLHSIDGKLIRVLSSLVSDRHAYLDIRPPMAKTITTRDGVDLQATIMLPPDVDLAQPSHKLPVLFHVYGGPQAPTVQNAFSGSSFWWHQMLCQQGYAVVLCDNRSARGRGIKDTWTIRGDMGRVELQDLEDAVKWVTDQPWADKDRIGMWGWSYGGYFTAYALTHSKLFKAGIAGAPVTDWRNYDAIYTERYMDLPGANEAGYKSSSVVEAAANLSGRLLIIHGERDDNVHVSNTLQLANALQAADKQFDLMIYPRNRHGITDARQRAHMQRLMTDFLNTHLK
jgi:dipeptidyl-peptidase 4